MDIKNRVNQLRTAMRKKGFDAYLLPSNDPHQSEYVAEHWQSRAWLSGFTGSAGLVIVTAEKAGLWTDSRYFIQAEKELNGSSIDLHPMRNMSQPEYLSWLNEQLPESGRLGMDGRLFTKGQWQRLTKALRNKNIDIIHDFDLISEIWQDRPPLPKGSIFELDLQYTGESRAAKLKRVRQLLVQQQVDHYLLTQLDDIAWLLNLRGHDVPFNPVFIAYLLIEKERTLLFLDTNKVNSELTAQLALDHVLLKDYDAIKGYLSQMNSTSKLLVEPSLNLTLLEQIDPQIKKVGNRLVEQMKAIKNSTEVDNLRKAMVKDGVALVKFFRWLEEVLPSGIISEYDCAQQLKLFRSQQNLYYGESFAAIVGYAGNGAIIHYRPDEITSAILKPEGLLLLDSGGQYQDGTTDITRTIALGTPSQEQKDAYTQVLKGHIALDSIQFPAGTNGGQLDVLARMHLWKSGKDYGHGTGHGVGFFLNVHEGPQGISSQSCSPRARTAFKPGMILSNEPGYYKTDGYGIRVENLILCVETECKQEGRPFFAFETLTLFPIEQSLINVALMEEQELDWLNQYHTKVFERLAPALNEAERSWLATKCIALHQEE
ncbi:MAG: aminopeptidase P family protein [Saprospiraceae bacterium]